jgi:hypothetical protein
MKAKTNPTPRKGKRNVFCPYYCGCLNTAILKQWSCWNCANCDHRTNREAEPEIPLSVNYGIAYYELATKE